MKSQRFHAIRGDLQSLPARGAWIEISGGWILHPLPGLSLPARGAWIEIVFYAAGELEQMSLPARGAWIEIDWAMQGCPKYDVAPRKGSVD